MAIEQGWRPHPVDPVSVDDARSRRLGREDVARVSTLLGLLADPTRLRIVHALDGVKELCVGDLCLALDATEDAVGYGLRLLRGAGLVATRKQGRSVFYRLAEEFPPVLREGCLRALLQREPEQHAVR